MRKFLLFNARMLSLSTRSCEALNERTQNCSLSSRVGRFSRHCRLRRNHSFDFSSSRKHSRPISRCIARRHNENDARFHLNESSLADLSCSMSRNRNSVCCFLFSMHRDRHKWQRVCTKTSPSVAHFLHVSASGARQHGAARKISSELRCWDRLPPELVVSSDGVYADCFPFELRRSVSLLGAILMAIMQ